MSDPYLQINNLKTHFPVEKGILFRKVTGTVKAVDGVSLSLAKGEVLGLVGESGCGKSTLGRTVLQLIKPTAGTVTLGEPNPHRFGRQGTAIRARRFPDDFPGPVRLAQPAHDRVLRCSPRRSRSTAKCPRPAWPGRSAR